jgi:phthalate 4,5-cis-dihydrodiol dehydrogenase
MYHAWVRASAALYRLPEEARLGTAVDAPLRFGIIGLGRGSSGMIVALAQHPSARITAAVDLRPEPLERFARDFEVESYTQAEALCASPDVDVVYVATPHQFHAEHVVMAAEHGKHVVVEKPMALTLEECDRMIAAAGRHGVKLVVGHTAGHNPAVKQMRRIVASGELGRLGLINVGAYTEFLYRARRPEELDTALGGGIIFNQVPHQVDAVRLVGGGLVRSVRSATGVWDPERPTEGSCAAFLNFEDGAAAVLVYNGYDHFMSLELRSWIDPAKRQEPQLSHGQTRRRLRELTVEQEEAALVATSGYGSSRYAEVGGDLWQQELGHMIVSCERGDVRLVGDGLLIYDDEGRRALPIAGEGGVRGRRDVIDEIVAGVTQGRPLIHDGRWGKATMAVCLAILQSARERREVMVDHQVPTADASLLAEVSG